MSYSKMLMNQFNVERHQVEQEGSKQCAVVYLDSGAVFVSYNTIVGFTEGGHWYFTDEKHSVTTSQQVGAFSASRTYLPAEVFDEALKLDACLVIEDYELKCKVLDKQVKDFSQYYRIGLVDDYISTHTIGLAQQLIREQGIKLFNKLTKDIKADVIYAIGIDEAKLKVYNKYKAKFTKALKAA